MKTIINPNILIKSIIDYIDLKLKIHMSEVEHSSNCKFIIS